MNEADMLALMKRFRVAYAKGERDELLAGTTEDFEWHQHCAGDPGDLPNGRLLVGVDALLQELAWRAENWSDVEYTDLTERSAGDVLLQTFTIRGKSCGEPFYAKAVDLYPVRDGRIARKDTYWKFAQS